MSDTTKIIPPPSRGGPRWIDLVLAAVAGGLLTLLLIGVLITGGLSRFAGTSASPTPASPIPSLTLQIRTAAPTTEAPSPTAARPTATPAPTRTTPAPTTPRPTNTPKPTGTP